ncbi:MAG: ribosome small subunit-dependent GTPase A [Oscillospiraceae bacterium]|nr:ribosome small subunit-dependent GTPase A [Oscillospiraceae bacterium]
MEGKIIKAVSGFYYVETAEGTVACRARGRFRLDKVSPLVGDRVDISIDSTGNGTVREIFPRKSVFVRPPVANIDTLVMVASAVIPVTDPFLIDQITAIAGAAGCDTIVCINKCDQNAGEELAAVYQKAGFPVLSVSAETGAGIQELKALLAGKVCAFTGNSGVGKSSILNRLKPELKLPVGDVSEKLGRGRHTTRHVELFSLDNGGYIADTPGFSSFDIDEMEPVPKDRLPEVFPEFLAYMGQCRFRDCSHTKEAGCRVRQAVEDGDIPLSRHLSYLRLYEQAQANKEWQAKDYVKYSENKKNSKQR